MGAPPPVSGLLEASAFSRTLPCVLLLVAVLARGADQPRRDGEQAGNRRDQRFLLLVPRSDAVMDEGVGA